MLKIVNTETQGEYVIKFDGSVIGRASKRYNWIGSGSYIIIELLKKDNRHRQIGSVTYKKQIEKYICDYMKGKFSRICSLSDCIADLDKAIDTLGEERHSTRVLMIERTDLREKIQAELETFKEGVYDYAVNQES